MKITPAAKQIKQFIQKTKIIQSIPINQEKNKVIEAHQSSHETSQKNQKGKEKIHDEYWRQFYYLNKEIAKAEYVQPTLLMGSLDHTTKALITSIMGGGYNNEISKEEGNKPPNPSESNSKPKKDKNMKELDLQKREVAYQNVEMDAQAVNSKPNEAQGVSAKGFPIIIKDLTYRYNLNLCVLLKLMFQDLKLRSEAEGFAGGIWCLWNKKEWNIEPLEVHKQFIHMNIKDNENRNWYCTRVYGSPQPGTRSSLREELENFAGTIQGPWCVGGNFNSIISLEETGGSFNLSQDSRRFQDCIQNCGLKDLGFSGPPFTWQRNRVKRRLDRFLCNLGFNDLFPSAGVKHLPKLKSDHIPILLDFNNLEMRRRDKPFRLLTPWLLHEDYQRLMSRCNIINFGDKNSK
ncbi:hypothetical protein Ahy_B03g064378 [Arachis hypogaea]|uniref:Endonuclease/exonuclease/phosphatase domain-containing protein n=1 Tax=Arachis hypogaea TaxID=3818 RepID=A0A444ZZG8_ARAHY|nr:hypothetical protein Ahy_B03g064378 [Arachis hypogaea]